MTKSGTTKSRTLGRLIFGEKRKQHASPSRHRSSTRNGQKSGTTTAPPPAPPVAEISVPPVPPRTKKSINLHDWSLWRIELNEELATILTERRSDLRSLRQFLQTSSFYQKENHDENDGRLLFSIPRAKFRREDLEKFAPVEIPEVVPPRSAATTTTRCSFVPSDRIHSTLQKAVKDGNVLEKIKAFEMQAAAAAAAQSTNSRIPSVAHRTLSPTVVVQTRRAEPLEMPTNLRTNTLKTRAKRTTTPRRRWLKSGEKQEIFIEKKKKKKNVDSISADDDEQQNETNTYDISTLQRRSTGKNRKKLSSTDVDDRLTRTIDRQGDQSELDDEPTDGNVFIDDEPVQRENLKKKSRSIQRDEDFETPVNDVPNGNATKMKPRAFLTNPPTKQMSKQILQAIMNSIHPNHSNQETINADFFDNGPLTNPEEILVEQKN